MRLAVVFIQCYFLLGFAGCSSPDQPKEWIARHVVFIGLDGWGAYSVEKVEMPNVKQLMAEGAYTLKKRSVLPSSSAANWASMFMGAGPELHGYTKWDSKTPDLPSRVLSHYGLFPCIFGLLRDAHPTAEIGYLYEWDGLKYLAETEAMNLSQNLKSDSLTPVACDYIRTAKPNLVSIIYDEPDGVGHRDGHDTPAYYAMLKVQDERIGKIVEAVKEAGIYDETVFIITSDHGGVHNGHGGKTMLEMETPFIISGKGVKKGLVFDESMMQFDIAPTIARIFRLKTPQVWIGRPMEQVFVDL
ncbi:2 3-bisphosphoglycerate-independent phosphoglycerate mutase [termite gut metagenome]|uniref:2 3-bisphosphoglycerate-independent phosphoglycerate mutase n=1 Tax=termite gut metagenome TaxID=433724 RepID=A0A5J4S789_9ZZZZ